MILLINHSNTIGILPDSGPFISYVSNCVKDLGWLDDLHFTSSQPNQDKLWGRSSQVKAKSQMLSSQSQIAAQLSQVVTFDLTWITRLEWLPLPITRSFQDFLNITNQNVPARACACPVYMLVKYNWSHNLWGEMI